MIESRTLYILWLYLNAILSSVVMGIWIHIWWIMQLWASSTWQLIIQRTKGQWHLLIGYRYMIDRQLRDRRPMRHDGHTMSSDLPHGHCRHETPHKTLESEALNLAAQQSKISGVGPDKLRAGTASSLTLGVPLAACPPVLLSSAVIHTVNDQTNPSPKRQRGVVL